MKRMSVLFLNRFDWRENFGGDSMQMLSTKSELEQLGIHVEIYGQHKSKLASFDLFHVFNIMRPTEAMLAIGLAKSHGKRVVMSSIYWDFKEFNRLGRSSSLGWSVLRRLPVLSGESIKDIFRLPKKLLLDNWRYIFSFYRYPDLLREVDFFLPNSVGEGVLLRELLGPDIHVRPVVNGIDPQTFYFGTSQARSGGVFCARIDPRKNHINLVRAEVDAKIDCIGDVGVRHTAYFADVAKENSGNLRFFGGMTSTNLAHRFREADFHVLPSWLETDRKSVV